MDLMRVGPFELDPSERRLSRDGVALELGGRAFDLLRVLAESPGRLVTKAALLERVWPRLVVDENNLSAQVATLRRILGSSAIKTVPGFGYRLELAVCSGGDAPAEMPPASADPVAAVPAEHAPLMPQRPAWPERLAALIGRDEDIEGVERALARASLVTLVGGAGIGKTRLAQEIHARAIEAQRAAAWVVLDAVTEPAQVPFAIAVAVGIALPDGTDGFTALEALLGDSPLLLVLDGAEHLSDALARPLATLVARTQALHLLVTSQAPLGVVGEAVYRLAPLGVPDADAAPDGATRTSAVELFVQRALAADRSFALTAQNAAAVASICRQLDGNPLALELAAARLPALGASALLARLDDRFRLLRRGGALSDPRHDALHAAFEWSYSLLSSPEQVVFDRLGAFAGSFTLDAAARAVADASIDVIDAIDLIGRLVDRSLVTTQPGDMPRYALAETARHYARERLGASGGREQALARMAATVLEVLEVAYTEYWSLDETLWLRRYGAELDNVRAALDWAVEHDRHLAVALYGAAWPLFVETDLLAEARARFEPAVRLIDAGVPRPRLARFWEAVATHDSMRQCDRARYAAELAATAYADSGEERAQYYTLMLLALNWRGDDAAAREVFVQARRLEDEGWPARLLMHGALTEGALLFSAGQFVDARLAYRRAVRLALTVSERQALAATVHIVELDVACDEISAALALGRPMALSIRHPGQRAVRFELLVVVFSALLLAAEREQARMTGSELYDLALRLDRSRLYTALDAMAYLACEERRFGPAARIALAADAAHEAHAQTRRGPIEQRLQASVVATLTRELGAAWPAAHGARVLGEVEACALALSFDL